MAISYQSKDSTVLGLQLKVQELVLTTADKSVLSDDGADSTIDVKETVKEVRAVIHCDDGTGLVLVNKASVAISGTTVVLSGVVLAANDSLIIKYVVAE